MGVILDAEKGSRWRTTESRWVPYGPQVSCPHCDMRCTEVGLIIHCNDLHQWDFLTIARKLEHLVAPPHEST